MSGEGQRCLVIGIGNPHRGDDGAGRAVARWLHGKLPPLVEIVEHDGETATLVARLEDAAEAYLIDASTPGTAPGTIRRFDVRAAPLPHDAFSVSTHDLGLVEAVELARAFGTLPARCAVYAIEAASFAAGAPLTPPVAAAVAEVGSRVLKELAGAATGAGGGDA